MKKLQINSIILLLVLIATSCIKQDENDLSGRSMILGEWEVIETVEEYYDDSLYYNSSAKFFVEFFGDGTGVLPNPILGNNHIEWIHQDFPEEIAIFQPVQDNNQNVLRFNIIDNERDAQLWQKTEYFITVLGELEVVTTWEMHKVD